MCSLSLDALSACHSLVQILCLVDHSDVLNCKLVSRRFRDLIRRNDVIMPRKTLERLYINDTIKVVGDRFSDRIGMTFAFIHYIGWKPKVAFTSSITNDEISFICCEFKSMKRCLQEHGVWTEEARPSDDTGTVQYKTSYAIDGMEKGLRLLLSLVLRHYHFQRAEIYIRPIGLWGDLIAEQFRKCRSQCTKVVLIDACPNFAKFRRYIGFTLLCITLPSALRTLVNVDGIWDRPIRLHLRECDHLKDIFEPTIVLVKKWLAGGVRIKWLRIEEAEPSIDDFQHKVLALIDGFRPVEGAEDRQFYLRRPADDVVLYFSVFESAVDIYDSIPDGPIPIAYPN